LAEVSRGYGEAVTEVDLARTARLIGDPARAAMLDALMGAAALAAGELARSAGVTAATASGHLGKLRLAGLVEVVRAGRHRYYRLASADVAHALEALAMISPSRPPARSLRGHRTSAALAYARTCYDHLAGTLGVAVHDALVAGGALRVGTDGYALTPAGEQRLAGLGVDLAGAQAARRAFAFPCLDATERRPHLAGALGAGLCRSLMERGWLVRRRRAERAVRLTEPGRSGIAEALGCQLPPLG
jgi:DNA-binding transcriptional ArsR family regulator